MQKLGLLLSVIVALPPTGAAAMSITAARNNAIVWLERNQNCDGSWTAKITASTGFRCSQQPSAETPSADAEAKRILVTAEALNALVKANRVKGAAAQKAIT